MKVGNLLIGSGLFFIAHLLTFFQLNGQFLKIDWFRKNQILVILFGAVLSIFYVLGTKYIVDGIGGLLWPTRFIGFGIGMISYALCVSYFFKEGINIKTWVSLGLSLILVSIQVFWKIK